MSDIHVLPTSAEPPARYDPADASIPRASVSKEFDANPGPCPNCGEDLRQHSHTYMVTTRHKSELGDPFVLGGDFGWFCLACPTVILDKQDIEEMLMSGRSRWDMGNRYLVVGILDLNAVPESKRDLPFDDDDNPLPLVPFTDRSRSRRKSPRRSRASKKVRAKRKQQKKSRRRNRRR